MSVRNRQFSCSDGDELAEMRDSCSSKSECEREKSSREKMHDEMKSN